MARTAPTESVDGRSSEPTRVVCGDASFRQEAEEWDENLVRAAIRDVAGNGGTMIRCKRGAAFVKSDRCAARWNVVAFHVPRGEPMPSDWDEDAVIDHVVSELRKNVCCTVRRYSAPINASADIPNPSGRVSKRTITPADTWAVGRCRSMCGHAPTAEESPRVSFVLTRLHEMLDHTIVWDDGSEETSSVPIVQLAAWIAVLDDMIKSRIRRV